MDLREHTSREFETELAAVRERLLTMGRRVDDVAAAAGRALAGQDVALANEIILADQETDAMELEIDHLCLEIMARRQPVASDLRFLSSALKIVIDLERVGDLGVGIATRVVELDGEPPLVELEDLLETLTLARGMVSQALEALVGRDVERAQQVIDKDGVVDALSTRIFEEVVSRMRDDPTTVFRATRLQSISKYVERIADHGTNIAELAIFVLTGADIRHRPRTRHGGLS
ncbi:MAG TPA: phosphate signaling complex protein PhoU [Polyangia bacterium]|nr:phosphate signaling complex protein PhoU [Polyangia bacterium]